MNFADLSAKAAEAASECSRRGDVEGSFYARGLRDAYAVAATFNKTYCKCGAPTPAPVLAPAEDERCERCGDDFALDAAQ